MKRRGAVLAAGLCLLVMGAAVARSRPAGEVAPATLIDAFESVGAWSAVPADGVEMRLSSAAGLHGQALRVDFDFVKGGGYAVLRRAVALDLPANYAFRFRIRGECPVENLELKLVDSTGANVWWQNRRDFQFPREWQIVSTRKRKITYAWGPAGGGEIHHVAAIEIAITAGSGGRGTVWLDDFELLPLPEADRVPAPIAARASSSRSGHGAARATDGEEATSWASQTGDAKPWLELDLGALREFGGLRLDFGTSGPRTVAVELEDGDGTWRRARTIVDGRRARAYLSLPEAEARRLRLRWLGVVGKSGASLGEVRLMPVEFGDSPESLLVAVARDAPRGRYPRSYSGEQAYWTIVGHEGGREKMLFGEDGAIEAGPSSFSVEPFLFVEGKLLTWADAAVSQSLSPDPLPVPRVTWRADSLVLEVTAIAIGDTARPAVRVRYRLRWEGATSRRVILQLAIRPFQVNPPTQFLNHPGGGAPIRSLRYAGGMVMGEGDRGIVARTPPAGFGAVTGDQGDITDDLARGRLPRAQAVVDSTGLASGALAYPSTLRSGEARAIEILIPARGAAPAVPSDWRRGSPPGEEAAAIARMRSRLSAVTVQIPDSTVSASLVAQLGWILAERSGAALRPGTRAYARTWIRDGALTSAALLRMGRPDVVREFIEWFAPFTYDDGKVPCCVDARGSDPVPEHDSEGEFIYLVAEYVRLTGDTALARRVWPRVGGAASYLDTLRFQRRTAEWRTPANAPYFGLLPPSISHEGYSAKPQHSYWDDLFALRGYRDAAFLAGTLGYAGDHDRLAAAATEFARDLGASMRAAMAVHRIDYVPGCADLGDFDATSTTIALDPVQAGAVLPAGALERTFERYWSFFRARRDGGEPWSAYTPYEMRSIGAFVRLGWRERADSLLTWFLGGQRPSGWRQWPEVVWREPREPHFLGDLPHGWVASDYIRSVLTMLAYEREPDDALVIAAGVPTRWARASSGVGVSRLATRWGPLSYHLGPAGAGFLLRLDSGLAVPAGGVRIAAPGVGHGWSATANNVPVAISETGEVVVRSVPVTVVLTPPR